MGKYTDNKAKGADLDRFVEKHIDIIVREIRKEVPGLKSVILMGGYGRGEGAVEIHKGKPRLMNDFDMYVITESQISDDFLEEVADRCSKLMGKGGLAHPEHVGERYDFDKFFHVDIRCLPERKLGKLPPTVRYFEMKRSAMVVYGKDSLKDFPDFRIEDIPISEALRLLMNRMMLMLMSFSPDFEKKGLMSDGEKGIMNYYIAKTYITMAEAILIVSRDFVASYRQRAAIFQRIYKKKFPGLYEKMPDLARRVKFFTGYKISPKSKTLDTVDEWFACREYLKEVFRFTLSKIISQDVPESWPDIVELMKRELGRHYFKGYTSYILRRMNMDNGLFNIMGSRFGQIYLNTKYIRKLFRKVGFYPSALGFSDPGLKILIATPLVLYSIGRGGKADPGMMKKARKELRQVYPIKEAGDWKSLRDEYLKPYSIYYLQRFV